MKTQAKPIEWIREGDCIRCTSHGLMKKGYPYLRRQGFNTRVLSRIIGLRRYGEHECFRHTCDHPWCINPDHIIPGTIADNNRDRDERGRKAYGEKSGRSKLTEDQVLAIRSDSRLQGVIAKQYGVTPTHIRYIKQRKTWRHLL